MSDLYSSAITELDLLQAPFWVAERLAIMCARKVPCATKGIVANIEELGRQVQSFYAQQVVDGNRVIIEAVAPCLNAGLITYYRKVALLIPPSALSQLEQHLVLFPAEAAINWNRLVSYFLSVYDDIQAVLGLTLPSVLIKDYVRLQFVEVSQQLAGAGLAYDENVVRQGLKQIMKALRQDAKRYLEGYWRHYDRPPLNNSFLKIRAVTAKLRFEACNAKMIGVPVSLEAQLKGLLTDRDYADLVEEWLRLHELKEDALRAQLDLKGIVKAHPPTTPTDELPSIKIEFEEINRLYNALVPFVVEQHRDDLRKVLVGEPISNKVTIIDRPLKSWCYVFCLAHEAAYIANSKAEVMQWLAYWFNVCRKGEVKSFTADQTEEYFYKRSAPSKSNRIPYKP